MEASYPCKRAGLVAETNYFLALVYIVLFIPSTRMEFDINDMFTWKFEHCWSIFATYLWIQSVGKLKNFILFFFEFIGRIFLEFIDFRPLEKSVGEIFRDIFVGLKSNMAPWQWIILSHIVTYFQENSYLKVGFVSSKESWNTTRVSLKRKEW